MKIDNFDIALVLRKHRHWKLFPCNPTNKAPLTEHGFKDATDDLRLLEAYWKKYPNALVGIPCEVNGFFVVDVDNDLSWLEFENKYCTHEWKIGLKQLTPRGGYHLFFRLPLGIHIPTNTGKLGRKIDLRGHGGYVCTGAKYTFLGDDGMRSPLTDCPDWLLNQIVKLQEKPEALTIPKPQDQSIQVDHRTTAVYFLQKYIREARPGTRNENGLKLACQLRDCGLSETEAALYMFEYAQRVSQEGHPYTDREALLSLKSAYSRARRQPIQPGQRRVINGR